MSEAVASVGVVGDGETLPLDALTEAGLGIQTGDIDAVLATEPDLILAVRTERLFTAIRKAPSIPILPVAVGRGVRSLAADDLPDVVEDLATGEWETETHPVLGVEPDGGEATRAAADVTLVTEQAAHISEFAVSAAGEPIDRFRADGVVVATPVGSAGYARRIGGPIVAPGTGVVAAPIAPFATDPDHWVLGSDGVALSVERDDADVTLLADDRTVCSVTPDEPVAVSQVAAATVAVHPQCDARW